VSKLGEVSPWLMIGSVFVLAGLLLAWVGVLEFIWHKTNNKKIYKPRYRRKGANYVK
jgi:hypothetical protein